jgi:hypothetical protein
VWECPFIIARLVDRAGAGGSAWTMVCVSPYPHTAAVGRPTNPPLFWLLPCGRTEEEAEGGGEDGRGSGGGSGGAGVGGATIDLARAVVGPVRLDLGDTLYAPTVAAGAPTTDAGRAAIGWEEEEAASADGGGASAALMMGWVQDVRAGGGEGGGGGSAAAGAAVPAGDASASPAARADYAGCLSVPRVVRVATDAAGRPRLLQAPAPGVAALRQPSSLDLPPWPADAVLQPGGPPMPIPGAVGHAVDVEVTLARGEQGDTAAGLWLRSRPAATGDAPGVEAPTAVALVAHWAAGRLEVVHFTRVDAASGGGPDWASAVRRVGGACAAVAAGRVGLRVLVDHSVVEAFADSGEALATRVNGCRGDGRDRAWSLFAVGSAPRGTAVPAAAGWAMRVGWEE